jgi:phytoene synthase
MADVVSQSTQPALGAIKLAWWRERLTELDEGRVPAEPRLQAAAAELLPRGITGAELAQLEDGYLALLQEPVEAEPALQRGVRLFEMASRLLGSSSMDLGVSGRLYAAGQLQRRRLAPPGAFVVTQMRGIPGKLRPLTALAVLARRDLNRDEREATPARALAILRHRLTGRIG